MKKEQKKLSIRAQIRSVNAKIMGVIAFMVICSIVNLLLVDLYQFKQSQYTDIGIEVKDVTTRKYQWMLQVLNDKTAEMNPEQCSFAVWYNDVMQKGVLTKDVGDALNAAYDAHKALHEAANAYIAQKGEMTRSELLSASDALTQNMNAISEYYMDRSEKSHSALVSRIIWAICTAVVLSVLSLVLARKLGDKLANKISMPISAVADWSRELSMGSADLAFDASNKTETNLEEVNLMIDSFRKMAESIQENVRVVKKVADGDMTAFVNIRSASDSLGQNLYRMVQSNDLMFAEITSIAESVATGSQHISQASAALAESCSVQAEAVKDFTGIIEETGEFIYANNAKAGRALEVSDEIQKEVVESTEKMQHLLNAMAEIRSASEKVSVIIKTIDGIATQTNLLALNAAIEAARAGEAGKGFAVVAGEVKDLAAKSLEAAEESKKLIQDTVDKTEFGDKISQETSETFDKITESISHITDITKEIAQAGDEQQEHIKIVKENIITISEAIEGNAAASEQAAAASDELNHDADLLKEAMQKFNLRKREHGKPYIPPEKQHDAEFIRIAEENYQKALKEGKITAADR